MTKKTKRSEPRRRRVPERTCIVCKARIGKKDLVRVAKPEGGLVRVDETGKGTGRGAYVCRSIECWTAAALDRRIEHALRQKLGPEDRAALQEWARLAELVETGAGKPVAVEVPREGGDPEGPE
jgi:predicted RNA-binding protein YlxR (DUF448 family)